MNTYGLVRACELLVELVFVVCGSPLTGFFRHQRKAGTLATTVTQKQHAKAVQAVKERKALKAEKDVGEITLWFVPYSLRHTCITRMAEDGLQAPDLMYFAGHRNIATTMKYIHLASVGVNYRVKEARLNSKRKKVDTNFDRDHTRQNDPTK